MTETRIDPAASAPSAPRPVPRPGILDVERYVPGKSSVAGQAQVWKLSSNESPLGPSPRASAAFAAAAGSLEHYPDGQARALRTAIAARFGLDPERILCGNGSDECLSLLATTYVGPGDEGIYSEHGFLLYPTAILAAGGTPVRVPERDLTTDVDALLAAVTGRTRIVYVTNPNNPTGTYLPFDEVKRLQAGLRPDILLVIDAAYSEYVRRNDFAAGLELVATCDNVVMTRTFSKIHGLAAARIGWMVAPPPVIDAVERIRPPFNINTAASAAGIAALEDLAHVERSIEHNTRWLDWLTAEITAIGLRVTPSVANFLLIHFPETPGRTASDADLVLQGRGLILRRVASYGLPNALRLSVGGEEANRLVVAALKEFWTS